MPRRITTNDKNISKPIANLRKDSGDDLTNPRCPRATPTTKGNKKRTLRASNLFERIFWLPERTGKGSRNFFPKIPEGQNEPGSLRFLRKKPNFKGVRRSWERLAIGQEAAILIALFSQPWRILISSLVVASIESFEFLM